MIQMTRGTISITKVPLPLILSLCHCCMVVYLLSEVPARAPPRLTSYVDSGSHQTSLVRPQNSEKRYCNLEIRYPFVRHILSRVPRIEGHNDEGVLLSVAIVLAVPCRTTAWTLSSHRHFVVSTCAVCVFNRQLCFEDNEDVLH